MTEQISNDILDISFSGELDYELEGKDLLDSDDDDVVVNIRCGTSSNDEDSQRLKSVLLKTDEELKLKEILNHNYVPNDPQVSVDLANEIIKLQTLSLSTKASDVVLGVNGKFICISPETVISEHLRSLLWNPSYTKLGNELINMELIEQRLAGMTPRMYFAAQYIPVGRSRMFTHFAALCVTDNGKIEVFKRIPEIRAESIKYKTKYIVFNEYLESFLYWNQNPFEDCFKDAISYSYDQAINTTSFCKLGNTSCALCTCLKMVLTDVNANDVVLDKIEDSTNIRQEFNNYILKSTNLSNYDFMIPYKNDNVSMDATTQFSPELLNDIWANFPISKGKAINRVFEEYPKRDTIAIGFDVNKANGKPMISGMGVVLCRDKLIVSYNSVRSIQMMLESFPDADILYPLGRTYQLFMEWASGYFPQFYRARQIKVEKFNVGSFCTGLSDGCATCHALGVLFTIMKLPKIQRYGKMYHQDPKSRFNNYRGSRSRNIMKRGGLNRSSVTSRTDTSGYPYTRPSNERSFKKPNNNRYHNY